MNNICGSFLLLLSLIVINTSCGEDWAAGNYNYTDAEAPVKERVEDLLSKMTLEEKIAQMDQYVGLEHIKKAEKKLRPEQLKNNDASAFYKNLHSSDVAKMVEKGLIGSFLHVTTAEEANFLQKLAMKSRLKIPLLIGIDAIHGNGLYNGATVYPTPLSLASTWDPQLVKAVGRQTAAEMRATGSHWAFTPNVDVARDARWGRVGETFGEDTYMASKMGVSMIKGLQGDDFSGNNQVIACAKHMIAGSEPVNGLNAAPMDVSERMLKEVFLPPYKAAVDAGVFTIMAAHNEVNGIPSHANKELLTTILKKEYGFEGFIVSDWMDIERLHTLHKIAPDLRMAYFQSIDAGMDMHMHGPGFADEVAQLLKKGKLSEERINESVRKILEAKFRLGLFENPLVDLNKAKDIIFNEEHQATALEAARKSIVLLKNDGILPIDKKKYKRIFITGPNADNQAILGDWVFPQPDENVITFLEGVKQQAPEIKLDYLNSGPVALKIGKKVMGQAVSKANAADLVVVVVGGNSLRYERKFKTSGENADRSSIDLAGDQKKLIENLYKTGKPVIVVLVNSRPLGTQWISDNIPALIEAWEPGVKGGQALAEIIFGEVNPSGKLPISIPRNAGQIQTIYNHKPSQYFHKYVTGKTGPLYPFGYGLSYTEFKYEGLKLSKSQIAKNDSTLVEVMVTNIGKMAGDEIIQLYINDEYSSVTRPVKELKAFKRISLKPGESKNVAFTIQPDMLAFYDKDMNYVIEPGAFKIMVGGSSDNNDLHKVTLTVNGEKTLVSH